jgi:hypothetical protein
VRIATNSLPLKLQVPRNRPDCPSLLMELLDGIIARLSTLTPLVPLSFRS